MKKILIVAMAVAAVGAAGQPVRQELNAGWSLFSQNGQRYPATVPGTVHTDLMAAGVISDPFFGTNEADIQWIDKQDWTYTTTFDVSENVLGREHVRMVFEGLDTYADVVLNGDTIVRADNMFRRWEADVRGVLRAKNNELTVRFRSPIEVAMPMWEATPWRDIIESGNDQAVRGGLKREQKLGVYVRKAGYHFGWDWGPRLVTSGIWRPAYIEAWDKARLDDVFFRQTSVTAKKAEVEVTVETALANGEIVVRNITDRRTVARGRSDKPLSFAVKEPRLWWTNGLGEPFLYEFEVELRDGGKVIDRYRQKLGLRSLRVVVEPDKWGESFYVELNGVPVFMKGANIIPQDVFLPRVTPERYERTIRDAVMSNMNMLRVWGGGIYEDEVFYDLCDANGILVWQDFMFSCALYPAEGALMETIKIEAEQNVRRLRNHTCIALWCGNNECLDMWFHWGVKRRYDHFNPEWSATQWRQFTDLYYKVLPEIVAREHPGAAYRKSSPYSDDYGLRSDSVGDYHDWDVWGQGLEFDRFNKKKSRFFSEYGFQGFPSLATVKRFAPDEKDWSPTSEVMLSHQRAGTNGNQKIDAMMRRDYGEPRDFESFCYLSQLMQADAMRIAMEAHRREMPRCMGSLIWQLNDCWPVASWSGVDWYGNWKAQQYAIKRAFDDVLVSPVVEDGVLKIYVVNDRATAVGGVLEMNELSDGDNDGLLEFQVVYDFNVPARSVAVQTLDAPVFANIKFKEYSGRVYESNFYPVKHKDMGYERPVVKVSMGGDRLTVSTDKFARGVCLVADGVIFSDNFFDLLPGESRTVEVLSGALDGVPRVITYADAVK